MRQIFFSGTGVPLAKPEDIIPLLGKKIHWREDRSAYEAAYSWFDAPGIPKSVRTVIETDRVFVRAVLDKAFFEKQTKLDAYRRPSQTDVLAILQTKSGVGSQMLRHLEKFRNLRGRNSRLGKTGRDGIIRPF